jgi:hypothetical protein
MHKLLALCRFFTMLSKSTSDQEDADSVIFRFGKAGKSAFLRLEGLF